MLVRIAGNSRIESVAEGIFDISIPEEEINMAWMVHHADPRERKHSGRAGQVEVVLRQALRHNLGESGIVSPDDRGPEEIGPMPAVPNVLRGRVAGREQILSEL